MRGPFLNGTADNPHLFQIAGVPARHFIYNTNAAVFLSSPLPLIVRHIRGGGG